MATIEPFKGIRYNMEKITDLSTVIAPPYDIINQSGQDAYYNQDPYNIIRLEYGKEEIGDSPANNRYTRARDTFNRWLEQKILLRESQPVFYLYRQSFTYRGTSYQRDGIIAALKVEPYGKGAILPHEDPSNLRLIAWSCSGAAGPTSAPSLPFFPTGKTRWSGSMPPCWNGPRWPDFPINRERATACGPLPPPPGRGHCRNISPPAPSLSPTAITVMKPPFASRRRRGPGGGGVTVMP